MLGRAQTRRDDDFSLKQNGSQITYPKMVEILPHMRSRWVMVFYSVTLGYKGGRYHPLTLSQPSTIRQSPPLCAREENTEEEKRS
jgi:hypothetical protein